MRIGPMCRVRKGPYGVVALPHVDYAARVPDDDKPTIEAASQKWVDGNESVWREWLS